MFAKNVGIGKPKYGCAIQTDCACFFSPPLTASFLTGFHHCMYPKFRPFCAWVGIGLQKKESWYSPWFYWHRTSGTKSIPGELYGDADRGYTSYARHIDQLANRGTLFHPFLIIFYYQVWTRVTNMCLLFSRFEVAFYHLVPGSLKIWFDARNTIPHNHTVGPISILGYNKEKWNAVGWPYCTLTGIKIWGLLASKGKCLACPIRFVA